MKVGIITDSNSGLTVERSKELGIHILPMHFMIDGKLYYEGVDLSLEKFLALQAEGADITTSQPSPKEVTKLWDDLLKEYDQLVHIPMSSGLSSSCQTAAMLAQDYEGKVFVVNNQRISVTQLQSAVDAKMLADKGKTGEEIKEILEASKFDSIIYVTVDTLTYLKKGGRVTPAAAALGSLLKLKPVLVIAGERLDAFAKGRTMKQAKSIMINAIRKELEEKYNDPQCRDTYLEAAYSSSKEVAEEWVEELKREFPGVPIEADPLALSIVCHIGPGAVAVACTRKIKVD